MFETIFHTILIFLKEHYSEVTMGVGKSLVSIVLGLSAAFNPLYSAENPDTIPPAPNQTEVPTAENAVERYLKEKGYYEKFVDKMRKDDPAKKDSEFSKYLKDSGLEGKIKEMPDYQKWRKEDFTFNDNPIPEFNPNAEPTPAPVPTPAPKPVENPVALPQPVPVPVPTPAPKPVENPVALPRPVPVPVPMPVPVPRPSPVIQPAPKPAVENPMPEFNPTPKPAVPGNNPQAPSNASDAFNFDSLFLDFKIEDYFSNSIPDDPARFFAGLYAKADYGSERTTTSGNAEVQGIAGTKTESGKLNKVIVQGRIADDKYVQKNNVEVKSNEISAGIGYENNRFEADGAVKKSEKESADPQAFTSFTSGSLRTDTYTDNKTTIREDNKGLNARINLNSLKSAAKKTSCPKVIFSLYDNKRITSIDTNVRTDVIDLIDPTGNYTLFFANNVRIKEQSRGLSLEASNSFKAEQWDDGEYVNYGAIARLAKTKITGPGVNREIDELAFGLVIGGEFNRHSAEYDMFGAPVVDDGKLAFNNEGLMCIYELSVGGLQIKDSDGIKDNKLSMFAFGDVGFYSEKAGILLSVSTKDNKSGVGEAIVLFSYGKDSEIDLQAFNEFHNYFRLANRTETGFNQAGILADLDIRIARILAVNQLASFKSIDSALMAGWKNDDASSRVNGSAYVMFPVDRELMIRTAAEYDESHSKGPADYIIINSGGSVGAVTPNGSVDLRVNVQRDERRKDSNTTVGLTYTYNVK